MTTSRALLLFLIISSTVSCSESPTKLSPLSADTIILAFGDSLTYGTGARNGQDYPSLLSKMTNLKVINEGVSGEISSEGLERLPTLLDQYDPNLLILMHGGNDILRKYSHRELKRNLLKMILECQQRNIEVILLDVPKPGIILKSVKLYEELAAETEIPAELTLLANILGDNSLKSDTIHPNAEGYQMLAEGITSFLMEYGAVR